MDDQFKPLCEPNHDEYNCNCHGVCHSFESAEDNSNDGKYLLLLVYLLLLST